MIAKILISSNFELIESQILDLLEKNGLKKEHPDVLYIEKGEKLGVGEARKIKDFLATKPYQADGKAVILEDGSVMTAEAQNTLLKTLEELPEKTLFIIGDSSENNFLPTVLSRCEIVMVNKPVILRRTAEGSELEKLINSTLEERFEYIEKCKDKDQLLKDLVKYYHQSLGLHLPGASVNSEFLKELLEAEKWASSNVNIRAILEYLMLRVT